MTRYAYNAKGERTTTALDLNVEPDEAPDHIDYEVDRITTRVARFLRNRAWKRQLPRRRTTTQVHTAAGPYTTSISEQSLDGTISVTTQHGQTTTQQRVEGAESGQWQLITTQPDRSYLIQAYENGRLDRTTRYDADANPISWISQQYDEQGRLYQTTDSRTGTSTRHYDENGRVWKISAPIRKPASATEGTLDTMYGFDALGQIETTTKPSGGQVHQVYNANGTLRKVHGHHTSDVEYRYNGRGEKTRMITFYGPENKPARTRWHYDSRGQLAFKQDAAGKRVRYTYTPAGKLETRTWARGVKTTYHYDEANHTDLRHIDYSDSTPDVHYTYTRLGQQHTVQDAGGLLTYAYREDDPLELESETRGRIRENSSNARQRSSDVNAVESNSDTRSGIRQNSDLSSKTQQRGSEARKRIRQQALASVSPNRDLYAEPKTLTYTKGDFGRSGGFTIGTPHDPDQDYEVRYGYDKVGRLESVGSQGYWFNYGYEPNSTTDRVKTTSALFVKKTEFEYEPGRDTITSVSNHVGFKADQLLSRYAYDYGPDGQRLNRATTQRDQEFTETFAYDPDTGGVTSSIPSDGSAVFGYQYDKIGNRLSATENESTTLYDPNKLNQYTGIIGTDMTEPRHDLDGNLTQNENRTFTWDGENRLTEIRERGSLMASYTYDYKSRRIACRVPSLNVNERYLYQDWNLIAVYNAGDTEPEECYTWGKDLSGSLHGAGGVGGLLFATKRSHIEDVWVYHYDANGNIAEVTSSSGGVLDAYQYDPFGGLVDEVSLLENRFRFSTKQQDREFGYHYYGYRYQDPVAGRWLSRDPIGEKGGLNLYAVLNNDLVNRIDLNGLQQINLGNPFGDPTPPDPFGDSLADLVGQGAFDDLDLLDPVFPLPPGVISAAVYKCSTSTNGEDGVVGWGNDGNETYWCRYACGTLENFSGNQGSPIETIDTDSFDIEFDAGGDLCFDCPDWVLVRIKDMGGGTPLEGTHVGSAAP